MNPKEQILNSCLEQHGIKSAMTFSKESVFEAMQRYAELHKNTIIEDNKEQKLLRFCQEFIKKQKISEPETIYQTDNVIINAYEFIEGICNIVGYFDEENQ